MLYDTDARKAHVEERIEVLGRDFGRRNSAPVAVGQRLARALRLPLAAAELETAPRALPRAVTPLHRRSTPPAGFGRHAHRI
jgi:hypothetical protein